MPRKPARREFKLEGLEDRQMMAGDVSTFALSRILYVTGDAAANGVSITDDGAGTITVAGLAQGGSATTINDGVSQTFTKIKDVVITMGKGDDAVAITHLYVNGVLYADGGLGNDVIGLGQFEDTGLIDDAVDSLLGALNVKKNAIFSTGEGDDTILAQNMSTLKTLAISTGTGNDTVRLEAHGQIGDLDYVPGVTAVKGTAISTSTGVDTVLLEKLNTKTIGVSLGSGDDTLTMDDVAITKTATLNGDSDGNTFVDLAGNTFGKLKRKNFATII